MTANPLPAGTAPRARVHSRGPLCAMLVALAPLFTLAVLPPASALAQTTLRANRITTGLSSPLCITHAPGDSTRMFVLERTGRIKIISLPAGTANATPFLDLSSLVATAWLEYGLLGIAFHPNYQQNGYFYVNYTPTPTSGTVADTFVVRYQVSAGNPNVANASSATPVLRFGFGTRLQHRAGWMDFGPDGYLYISTGDGGENDPDNASQNTTLLRGKLLRIDVNGPDGIPGTADDDGFPADVSKNYCIPATNPFAISATNAKEIWAYGLRNPWRCSFDRLTGDLWIGDVGQSAREEIDFISAGSPGGRNFGWRCTEGTTCTGMTGCTCNAAALTPPIHEYPRTVGVSVTGGYVYRGCAIPDLRGTYIFADYQNSKMFSLRYNGTSVTNYTDRTTEIGAVGLVASLGEDNDGELYTVDYSGGFVYKLVARITPPVPVAITQHPANTTTCASQATSFTVTATTVGGAAAYQWQIETTPNTWVNAIDGPLPYAGAGVISASGSTTNLLQLQLAAHNGDPNVRFRARVSNACGSLFSNPATLTILQPCALADIASDSLDTTRCANHAIGSEDLDAFITAFIGGNTAMADVASDSLDTTYNPNGAVGPEDLDAFIASFIAGC